MILLKLTGVYKSYGIIGTDSHQPVLSDLSLELGEGQSMAIVGPSGSGKTTLLNLIGTLDLPDRGTIQYKGSDITLFTSRELVSFRNRQIGFVFQQHHLLPQCTLLENVLLPTLPGKGDRGTVERAERLIRRVGLWEHRNKKPQFLSGGECQRTAVVRALINSPGLLLADEPTGALDQDNSGQLVSLLLELNSEEKVSMIVVTHSRELAGRMQSLYRLVKGRLEPVTDR